tara:strand:+ start:296 stop:556 length:261 start_codon:yes stop_codon:yes gene_type:complete
VVVKVGEVVVELEEQVDQVVVEFVVQEHQEIHLPLVHHRVIMVEREQVVVTMEQVVVVELQRQVLKVILIRALEEQDLVEQEPQHL